MSDEKVLSNLLRFCGPNRPTQLHHWSRSEIGMLGNAEDRQTAGLIISACANTRRRRKSGMRFQQTSGCVGGLRMISGGLLYNQRELLRSGGGGTQQKYDCCGRGRGDGSQ